jgi:tripartite-type tricarboxylate transporter receptor subunit TctC
MVKKIQETRIVWTRREFIAKSVISAGATLVPSAFAQNGGAAAYPNRPIRFFAGFPPGGVADQVARHIVPELSVRLGQPIIIDNRAGAGGVIGVDAVAKAPPDGYTMGFGVSGALTSSVTLSPKLPYDPTKDVAPISLVVSNPLVLVVLASSGLKNIKDFVAAAKAANPKFNYGTAGVGTAMHLAGELLKQTANFEMNHAPYKGSAPAATDLLGGHIMAAILDLATAKQHIQSGRLTALGLTSPKRTPLAPEIPTIAESGYPGYEFISWFGLVMPSATPQAILTRVHTDLVSVLHDPAVRKRLADAGIDPAPGTPEEMRAQIKREIQISSKLIKAAGITVD